MHTFVVVAELPVECLLGSDFLMKHATIIDYKGQCLLLGKGNKVKIPLCESGPIGMKAMVNVTVSQNVTIALHIVHKLMLQLDSTYQAS